MDRQRITVPSPVTGLGSCGIVMSDVNAKPVVLQILKSVDSSIASVAYSVSKSVQEGGMESKALLIRGDHLEVLQSKFDHAASLNLGSHHWKGVRLKLFVHLYRFIKQNRPDVVLVHRYKEFAMMAMIARLLGGLQVIAVFHGERGFESWQRSLVCSWLVSSNCHFVAVSGSVQRYLVDKVPGLKPKDIEVIYNGIDFKGIARSLKSKAESRAELGLSEDAVIYGSVGRLVKAKGTETLIKAFSETAQLNPKAMLVLIGEGNERGRIETLVDNLEIGDRVVLLGNVNEAPVYLNAFDFFVFPSIREGFGLALVEAFAAKIPVIFSNLDVFKIIAIDHTYMAKAGDVAALVHKMEEAACNGSEQQESIINKQYDYASEQFSVKKAIAGYQRLLLKVVS